MKAEKLRYLGMSLSLTRKNNLFRAFFYIYKIDIVGIYVCMYIRLYIEKDQTNLQQTWHAYSLTPGRYFRNVKKCPGFKSR
jgi:hypothetical protein